MADLLPPDAKHVYSSNIEMIGYWPDKQELVVMYKTGKIYAYMNVDPKRARETMDAPSIGEAMQAIKKNKLLYPYKPLN